MNERLKEVRKAEGLTQREFGRRLGVQDTAISKLESGERNLTDQMILSVCREFNINEDWLRTGEGGKDAMYSTTIDSKFEAIMQENKLDNISKNILRAFFDLPPKKREYASDFIYALSRAVLGADVDSVFTDIAYIIDNSNASGSIKASLKTDVRLAFTKRFPHIGEDNVDINELEGIPSERDKGLTEEEEVALVHKRHADAKKGTA